MNDLNTSQSVRITRAVWLVLAVATTALYAVPVATQWATLRTICHPISACTPFQLDTASARTLSQFGISMGTFAVFTVAVWAAAWVIWYGLAALIIWRKPQDRGAILSAFFLVTFLLLVSSLAGFIPTSSLAVFQPVIWIVPFSALLLFGLLFPDGHFAPRWTRWLAVAGILVTIASAGQNSILSIIPVVPLPMTIVGVQIYRFRRVSTWDQRQQIKWALSGLVVGILGFFSLIMTTFTFGTAQTEDGSLFGGFSGILSLSAISVIPICIGIAVLRSRLWDIDRIISRALAYAALSLTLAAIYIGSVIGLQALFRAITGQQSDLAVAISTLVIAALFNPLRHRIQDVIARTFSRRKYNAQQVLAAFAATCRDETDLEKLRDDVMRVVEETVQPAQVSLWLRDSPGRG